MTEPDIQALADKAAAGGTLTDEEQLALMSSHEDPPGPDANLNDESEPGVDVKIKGLPEGVHVPGSPEDDPNKSQSDSAKDDKQKAVDTGKATDKSAEGKTPEPQKEGDKTSELSDASVEKVKDALKEENPNLEGLNQREKGLYFDLKAERASRQEAEERARKAEFRAARLEKRQAAIDKGEDPDAPEPAKTDDPDARYQEAMREVYNSRLELDRVKTSNLPHFDEIMKLADAGWVPDDKKKLVQEAMNGLLKGKSPYRVTYDLITSDPRWAAKKAELDGAKTATDAGKKKSEDEARIKAEEAAAAAKALETNKSKITTSGAAGGDGGGELPLEYDMDKLMNMSESEFGKLDPKVQEAILRKLNTEE